MRLALVSGVVLLAACQSAPRDTASDMTSEPAMSQLTAEEAAEGFRLLFDGTSTEQWRGFRQDSFPASGWETVDGELRHTQGGGDIITRDQFANFELRLQWKIWPGGNSGIFFHVTEDADATWQTGPEMQVLDDAGHENGQDPLTSAGSDYALHPSTPGIVRAAGEWNDVRIVVNGPHVEHWLNGTKVVDYELWSDDWEALVAGSKFIEFPGFGRATTGHIGLQDHGDTVAYRNIRIKVLP